jgi:hypothetical protein
VARRPYDCSHARNVRQLKLPEPPKLPRAIPAKRGTPRAGGGSNGCVVAAIALVGGALTITAGAGYLLAVGIAAIV